MKALMRLTVIIGLALPQIGFANTSGYDSMSLGDPTLGQQGLLRIDGTAIKCNRTYQENTHDYIEAVESREDETGSTYGG